MDPLQSTIQTWDTLASVYQDKFMDLDLYNDTYDAFCRLVAKPGARIFEIACGPGNITRYLLSQRPDYDILATDAAPNMVELAQKNCPEARFEVMDCRDIGKLPGPFDGVVCGFCLPYLSKEDVNKLIKDIAGLLATGGVFYLSAIEGDYAKSRMETGSTGQSMQMYYYSEAELLASLHSHGFETLEVWRKPHDGEKAQWIWLGRRL
jgi:cyclopropane fatty-acyl-phospholipid synthase-like methyltransferase